MSLYQNVEGLFGIEMAIMQRKTKALAEWWKSFGSSTPDLQKFAMEVLSLTCSASGCERNWSTFEHIHSKKRNRLSQKRLNDLVYVKYIETLKRCYEARDRIDPITLQEDELVFDDDSLTWDAIARASGVGEEAYNTRSVKGKGKSVVGSTSFTKSRAKQVEKGKKSHKRAPSRLKDDEEIVST